MVCEKRILNNFYQIGVTQIKGNRNSCSSLSLAPGGVKFQVGGEEDKYSYLFSFFVIGNGNWPFHFKTQHINEIKINTVG